MVTIFLVILPLAVLFIDYHASQKSSTRVGILKTYTKICLDLFSLGIGSDYDPKEFSSRVIRITKGQTSRLLNLP